MAINWCTILSSHLRVVVLRMSPIIHRTDNCSQTHFPEVYLNMIYAENQLFSWGGRRLV